MGRPSPPDQQALAPDKVSRLRSVLGPGRLGLVGSSYVLTVEPGECDLDRFEGFARQLADDSGLGPRARLYAADEALALCRGPLLGDLADEPFVGGEAVRFDQLRLRVAEQRVELLVALGDTAEALRSLEPLDIAHPYNERICELKMLALAGSGRVVEALRAYQSFRARLVEDIGIEPSARLTSREASLLRGHGAKPAKPPSGASRTAAPRSLGANRREGPWVGWNEPIATRPTFVGRESTMAALRRDLLRADGLRGCVLTGEGGVGKTRVVIELMAAARQAAVPVRLLRCRSNQPLLSPLSSLTSGFGPAPQVDWRPSDASARLIARFAGELARELPAGILVVEDLQWADGGTLDVVASFALGASVQRSDIAVVLTTRPLLPGDERQRWLAMFLRDIPSTTVNLQGLSEPEVFELLSQAAGLQPAPALSDELHWRGGGNPLLALTGLENLRAGNGLQTDGNNLMARHASVVNLPADLTGLLDDTLAQLSALTRQALMESALSYGEPRIEDLPASAAVGTSAVADALREAQDAGVVELHDGAVTFRHDLYRYVISAKAAPRDLPALHQALLTRIWPTDAHRAPPSSGRLMAAAHHAEQSGELLSPAARLNILQTAGESALHHTDWAVAARWLRQALALSPAVELSPAELMRLQYSTAAATYRAHDQQAQSLLPKVIEEARQAGDLERSGLALLDYCRALAGQSTPLPALPMGMVERFVEDAIEQLPELCARLLAMLAEYESTVGNRVAAGEHLSRADALANRSRGELLQAEISFAAGLAAVTDLDLVQAADRFERSVQLATRADSRWVMSWGLGRLMFVKLLEGAFYDMERIGSHVRAVQISAGTWGELSFSTMVQAHLHDVRGEDDLCEARSAEAERLVHRSGFSFTTRFLYPLILQRAASRGDLQAFDDADAKWARTSSRVPGVFKALRAAVAGDIDLAKSMTWRRVDGVNLAPGHLSVLAAQCEVAMRTGQEDLALLCIDALDVAAARGVAYLPSAQRMVEDQRAALTEVAQLVGPATR